MRISILAIFFITSVFQACAQKDYHDQMNGLLKGTVDIIKAPELDSLKKSETDFILLDVRQRKEYDISHIEDAYFIEYDEFSKSDVKQFSKDTPVVVYCTAGYRSERIGEKLKKLGYSNVSNLYGGILDWKNNDFDVLNDNLEPTDSVHTYNKSWSQWLQNGVKVYE